MKPTTLSDTQTRNIPMIHKSMPPDPIFPEHVRGGEPKSIGTLMEPIIKIIEHPDRNRLMTEFFRRN